MIGPVQDQVSLVACLRVDRDVINRIGNRREPHQARPSDRERARGHSRHWIIRVGVSVLLHHDRTLVVIGRDLSKIGQGGASIDGQNGVQKDGTGGIRRRKGIHGDFPIGGGDPLIPERRVGFEAGVRRFAGLGGGQGVVVSDRAKAPADDRRRGKAVVGGLRPRHARHKSCAGHETSDRQPEPVQAGHFCSKFTHNTKFHIVKPTKTQPQAERLARYPRPPRAHGAPSSGRPPTRRPISTAQATASRTRCSCSNNFPGSNQKHSCSAAAPPPGKLLCSPWPWARCR